MIKSTKKIGLNRDTLRKLDAGELSQAKGGGFNSSYGQCKCSSSATTMGGWGPSNCIESCDL